MESLAQNLRSYGRSTTYPANLHSFCTVGSEDIGFIVDKEQIKPGLIIFRRGDVGHDNFYCRVRIQNEDRYKTISLRTADRQRARDRAMDQDADIRFRVKHDVPVFNRSFLQVAEEYADVQQRRAYAGETS